MSLINEPAFPLAPAPFSGACCRAEAGASFEWLRQGWALFALAPGLWMAGTAVGSLFLLCLLIVPQVGKYAALMFLPMLLAGGLAVCRKQTLDEKQRFADFFSGFQRQRDGLITLGVIYMAAGLVLRFLAWLLPVGGFFGDLVLTMVLLLPLLLPITMATWFAPALVYFHGMKPQAAMQASFHACASNWLPFLVFSVVLTVLVFFAILPVLLGFLVLLPVMIGALYASYRDIFPAS